MKLIKALTVATLALTILASPAHAIEASPVSQGDVVYGHGTHLNGMIYIQNDCTVGYVSDDKAWVAAHCANNGSQVFDNRGQSIGTMRHVSQTSAKFSSGNDIGYIELTSAVGGNRHSGNAIADKPSTGDTVCMFSRKTNRTDCGEVSYITGGAANDVIHVSGISVVQGDSGGPAWIPGEGFIGVISALTYDSAGNVSVLIAHAAPFVTPRSAAKEEAPTGISSSLSS